MRGETQLGREEVSGPVLNVKHHEKVLRVGIMYNRGSELDQASQSFPEERTIPPCSVGHLPRLPVWAVGLRGTVPACPAPPKD